MLKLINNIRKKGMIWGAAGLLSLSFFSCNNYLDIVPDDGIATIETAFNMRSTAIRYLYTCYGFNTSDGDLDQDAAFVTGDEIWSIYDRRESTPWYNGALFNIARGLQSASSPYANDWSGIYEGIRCCNILIEKAHTVPDLPEWEAEQWIAEAKVLKAYYHFHLLRKWGPIPVIKENLPINAPIEQVRVYRDPVDTCFNYMIELLDEAIPNLPIKLQSRDELGRINKPVAAALKAKISVYAASPLFNNNMDFASLVDKRGTHLFDTNKSEEDIKARWSAAVDACKEAIDICTEANNELYTYNGSLQVNDTIKQELTLRNAFTEKWNTEIIWGNTHTSQAANTNLQQMASPNLQYKDYPDMPNLYANIQAPFKIAEMFYTNHGLPIANDKEWLGKDVLQLRTGDRENRWYIREGYETVEFNFNREPRFYAWLGFDGGQWYGQKPATNNPNPSDLFWIACRVGYDQAKKGYDWGPVTGYFLKKVVHPENRQVSATGYSAVWYPWPIIRLSDLYLLYAEAINEAEGPTGAHSADMFKYINAVRERANIPDVKTAWDKYSNSPKKYSTQQGMRDIIHQERSIELSFESERYWDIRRWKTAPKEYQKGIYGYKVSASKAKDYYQLLQLEDQKFSVKDYFWPIQIALIEQNPNLIQNLGW